MSMQDGLLYIILNTLKSYMLCKTLGLYFDRERERIFLPLLYAAYFLEECLSSYMIGESRMKLLLSAGALLFLLMAGYKGRRRKKVLMAVLSAGVEGVTSAFSLPGEVWCIFFWVTVYFVLEDMAEKNRISDEQKEREIIKLQLEMYKRQLNVMEEQGIAGRILRHDMKHHTRMLADYINQGENRKALDYMKKLELYAGGCRQKIRTGNGDVDSILNYFAEEADRIGGNVTMDVQIIQKLLMDGFDINVILGNLLLNACEAMKKSERKELSVVMGYARGILTVNIKNTYNGILKQKGGRIMTTKDENDNHGMGLMSIRKTVDKYDGEMEVFFTPEVFKVKVMLFVPPTGQ